DETGTPIDSGAAPFTGRFKPQQPLSGLDGIQANGTWSLEIENRGSGAVGTLDAWSLTLTLDAELVCGACSVSPPALAPVTVSWSPGSTTSLEWAPIAGATFYNVYRGARADLPNLLTSAADSCRRATTMTPVTGGVLGETPQAGSLHWYLVRAANDTGQGSAGDATAGPRSQESTGYCP